MSQLRRLFDELEEHHGSYLFRDVRDDDVEALLGILTEAVCLAGDELTDGRTRRQAERAIQTHGAWAAPDMGSDIVQQLTDDERRNVQGSTLHDVITAVISSAPDHPWRGRIRQPPEHLLRENPVDRAWLETAYRRGGDPDWKATAEKFERRHNVLWPDAGSTAQILVTVFCRRNALPTVPPHADGPNDVWQAYRDWRHEGGNPKLLVRQRWVSAGQRPTLVNPDVDADGYEVYRRDARRPEPETIYPPHLLPLKFSPYGMTVDSFMEGVVDKLWADIRANIHMQASLLAAQMPANWRPINSTQRDAAALKIRAERLYRYVAEALSIGQLTRYPRGSAVAAHSTVSTQIHSLAEQLGVDLSRRKPGAG